MYECYLNDDCWPGPTCSYPSATYLTNEYEDGATTSYDNHYDLENSYFVNESLGDLGSISNNHWQ